MNFLKICVVFSFFIVGTVFAEKVEITSDSMEAENLKKQVHFIGNVKIKQSETWLHGDTVIVYFNENNETSKYEALGSVKFEFKNEKSFYKGSANKVTYLPQKSQYTLVGQAMIDDKLNKRHLNGDNIILDMITGNAQVMGTSKKPVKFIFDMGSSK